MVLRLFMLLCLPLFMWAAPKHYGENIWVKVGQIYGIEPSLLYSIAKVESDLDRYVVAFSANKMTQKQARELEQFLKQKGIESKRHTQVIAIKSKNRYEASHVVHFLYTRNYPRFDMGIMQINSIHKPMLDRANISLYDLFDPKVNIQVGAYILATCFAKHKNNKDAINAYNGKIKDNPYSAKVFKEFKKLYSSYQKDRNKLAYKDPS
ncbi:lytic transglycosylase domain-containing protein [Sulfurospirillum deleyianum]|uniref:Lytic transglycosylase catalytic n=1 Tax=Sulfurospirillum deleyianum (strain ATCC 51133 / DSM 6946 / 5175) TaxID=525898 RepID=D1B4J7_SULD5|nr:lytic transglycosylase domain-containing protein [Sulfurospirillum deleyianum]ACZ13017.1 Lytic transglycosylase catalytic [Sulfurospirillum deleyianum DSM 6946]